MVNKLLKRYQNWLIFFNGRKLLAQLRAEVDILKSNLDMPKDLIDRFYSIRQTDDYMNVFVKDDPLVTVCICTYNRGRILVERSIPSVLNQTYKNIELLVIGDCCKDDTVELVKTIKDPRLHFINLPERGKYPENPDHRWRVAGTEPVNHALALARGDFITHLDDDDEFVGDRIEKLIKFIQREKVDLVWHPFLSERPGRGWSLTNAWEFAQNNVTTSSILYHRWFASIPWDIEAYRYHEPGDWNRLRKFKYLGALVARYPEPLLKHYCERNQKSN